jgi:hypothetical protein
MGKFLYMLVLLVLVAGAFAAPKEESDSKAAESAAPAKKETSVEERNVLVADDTWNTWVKSSSWTIITGSLGAVFLLAGLGVGFYYYYYVNAAHVYDNNNIGTPNAYNGYQQYSPATSTSYAR